MDIITDGVGFSNILYSISTTNPSDGWTEVTLNNPPSPRSSPRLASFGGIIYLTAGWSAPALSYYNDVYALDAASAQTGSSQSWVLVTANGTNGLPPPRNAFTWDAYGPDLVLFGGFWHNIAIAGPYTDCDPAAQCT